MLVLSEGSKKNRLVLGGYYASMKDEDTKKGIWKR